MTALGAQAQDGDAARGEILAYTCLGCHGIAGYRNAYPSYRVPKLGGQSEAYVVAALRAYKSGERTHATMRAQAASLSDDDMRDIAAYFAAYGEAGIGDPPAVVPDIVTTCAACHGENGEGQSPEWPTLSGQHEDYLVNALKQYKLETVSERRNAIMAGLVTVLSDQDIAVLSEYYASIPGLFTTLE